MMLPVVSGRGIAGGIVAFVVLLMVCTHCLSDSASLDQERKVLYLQMAQEGVIEQDESEKFTLILNGVTEHLPYFSEHPGGETGRIQLDEFLSLWDLSIETGGALITVISDPDDAPQYQESAVVLSEPYYDKEEDLLLFSIRHAPSGELLKPGTFSEPLLFIDSWQL